MSRTTREFTHTCYRHPKGALQNTIAYEKAKEEGVHVRNREVPDAWDDMGGRNESHVIYKALRKMMDEDWSEQDIVHHLVRKWNLKFPETIDLVKKEFKWREECPTRNRTQMTRMEKKRQEQLGFVADEIIGDIVKVGIKQLHQVAFRWTKRYNSMNEYDRNTLTYVMKRKLKDIGADYSDKNLLFVTVKNPTIYYSTSFFNKKNNRFVAVNAGGSA